MGYSILDADGRAFEGSLERAEQKNFGKTKRIFHLPNGNFGISHEDVLTAFDNPDFTAQALGKGTVSAYSSAILFRRIEEAGVRTTHRGFINSNTTEESPLEMLPFEIIWRRYNVEGNSWEQRNPKQVPIGQKYHSIKYEVGLKWSVIDEQTGEECTDPFMMLDENFQPLLTSQGLPRLVHQKKGYEITYSNIVHPNKKENISPDTLRTTIEQYKQYASQIRTMAEKVQEVTFDTYARVGRLNADGKIEVGFDQEGNLTLGDELELDALRNVSLSKFEIDGQEYEFDEDALGHNLHNILKRNAGDIDRIILARHSGKQAYRDLVKPWGNFPMSETRKAANNLAGYEVTNGIYLPTAQALSRRFGQEVGYILRAA